MAEDLMSTQTGGYGETIQSAPEVTPTPEQFNVQLPPVEPQQPPAEPPVQVEQQTPPIQAEPPVQKVTEQVDVTQEVPPQEPPVQTTVETTTQEVTPAPITVTSTIDGEPIFDPSSLQKQEEKKPLDFNDELEYTEKGPSATEDGEVIMNIDTENDEESINQIYSGSTAKLRGSKVISLKNNDRLGDPKKQKPKPDGFYRYAGQPESIYEKRDGDWYKSTDGGNNYFKIEKGDVEKRIEILESETTKFKDPKKSVSNILSSTQGNVAGKFNLPNTMVTAGGNPLVSKNIQFNDLTKSNIGSETDRYNKDGTLNFNYNREVAQMAPENKAIYEASKNEKPDGIYRFPGREDVLYKKEGKNWYIDLSNTGEKFEWINTETPKGKERVGNLQSQAVPATTYAQLKLMQIPDASKLGTTDGFLDLLDVGEEISKINSITQSDKLKSIFDQGKNFVDTEIMNFTKDNLTKDQKENLIVLQNQINQIIGDGSYSDLKAKRIAELLSDGEQFFEEAVTINDKVNKAYSSGMSLDRLTYENKKKTFANDFDQKTMSESDMYAAKTFEEVRWMTDFVIENVDSGNLKINPKTGAIEFTEGASPAERKYIDAKLSELLKKYESVQDQKFAEVKDQIIADKSKLSDIRVNINLLNDQLAEARRKGDYGWANEISSAIKSEKQKMSALQKKINDSENLSNTLFLTNPKKIIDNVAGLQTNSSKAVFESIPKGLSPKQRFDLYYEALQAKNQQIAKLNGINYQSLDRFDMRLKDLLDWGEFYSLSDAEQEFLKNKATLNALRSLYYNNDTGFTGATAGFWESLVNGYAKALQPKTSAADGYQSDVDKAQIITRFVEDEGFSEDDVVTPDALEKIKQKSVLDFWSKESFGSMVGTSGAYMQMIILASEMPGFALKTVSSAEKLITGVKTLSDAERYAKGVVDAYDAAMATTKLGRFLKPVIKEGVNFEIAGDLFNDPDNQLNFVSGASGGALGEGFSVLAKKMGASKLGNYVSSIFGDQAGEAFKVLERVGRLSARGFGEVPQETGEELANIYMNSSNFQEMMDKASESFGTFDKIQQFVLSSFILGTAFGLATTRSAKQVYDTMPEDKRQQVDQVLSQLKSDINKGQQAANNYAETMTKREDVKEKINKDDQENKPGVSSEERVGEKPVEEQPVAETSQEEVSPSGVVQEEQVQVEEVAPEEAASEKQTQQNLTKEEIEARRKETEAKIKRKDLFDGVGEFSSTLGNSDKAAVPFSHREKNGIEVVEFAHPDTGSIDVIITGTSNNDFVGFYRIYENGKPTNRWSSKFENQSRNKENFKTMISSVQELLPDGHEYTEKTSISTDGLRVWNQQLDRGYELQYDENGNLVTNEVAINGDAIVNELGIDVERGTFSNINVRSQAEFEKVKEALLPYLQKFGLNESNIRWMSGPLKDSGTVKIDLPVLKKSTEKTETSIETQTTEEAKVNEETSQVESNVNPFQELSDAQRLKGKDKVDAIKRLKDKYGPDYNRISKIAANFDSIVRNLKKNNLINIDC